MGARDLITEIHYASQLDPNSLQYLRDLSQDEWLENKHALGQCLQDFPYQDDFDGFCDVVVIAGDHGIHTLREYLGSTSGSSRSAAIKTISKIGGASMKWAIPMLDETAGNADIAIHIRNQAAKTAAILDGRPEPEAIVDTELPRTLDALREALSGILSAHTDATSRAQRCANALGSEAIPLAHEALVGWFKEDVPFYKFQYFVQGCTPFKTALMAILETRGEYFERAVALAPKVFFAHPDLELLLDQLLADESDERLIPTIAYALASVTGEDWLARLDAKDDGERSIARGEVEQLDSTYLARHVLILIESIISYEGLYGWGTEIDVIVNALNRVPGVAGVLVAALKGETPQDRYWRPQRRYGTESLLDVLRKIRDQVPDATWADTVVKALSS